MPYPVKPNEQKENIADLFGGIVAPTQWQPVPVLGGRGGRGQEPLRLNPYYKVEGIVDGDYVKVNHSDLLPYLDGRVFRYSFAALSSENAEPVVFQTGSDNFTPIKIKHGGAKTLLIFIWYEEKDPIAVLVKVKHKN